MSRYVPTYVDVAACPLSLGRRGGEARTPRGKKGGERPRERPTTVTRREARPRRGATRLHTGQQRGRNQPPQPRCRKVGYRVCWPADSLAPKPPSSALATNSHGADGDPVSSRPCVFRMSSLHCRQTYQEEREHKKEFQLKKASQKSAVGLFKECGRPHLFMGLPLLFVHPPASCGIPEFPYVPRPSRSR